MSATNATTNYNLPLFIGTDKPAWLVDFNGAMTAIDGQMKINATDIQSNVTAISGLSTTVTAHTASISSITSEVSTLATGLNGAQGAINTIQSLIGNGEPTTTDKTLIGAINEIYGMITGGGNEIEAENVAYDNTSSGLTATNVQAAIDEVNGKDAGDIDYDNTTSGLTATNVQAAIDELAGASPVVTAFEMGEFTAASIASGQSATETITFTKTYTAPPLVNVFISLRDTDQGTHVSDCSPYALQVTTTGCTIAVTNKSSTQGATNIRFGYVVYPTA